MKLLCLLALALAAGALLSWSPYDVRGEPLRFGAVAVDNQPSVQSSVKSGGCGVLRRFTTKMCTPAGSPRKLHSGDYTRTTVATLGQTCITVMLATKRTLGLGVIAGLAFLPAPVRAGETWTVAFGGCTFSGSYDIGVIARVGSCPTTSGVLYLIHKYIKAVPEETFRECGTEELHLSINSLTSLTGIVFPSSLKNLMLDSNGLSSVKDVVFPSSLKVLDLSQNPLTSVNGVVFPSSLQILYLEENLLTSLNGVVFPSSLETLSLRGNKMTSLDGVVFPSSLKKLILSAGWRMDRYESIGSYGFGNSFTSVNDVVFPSSLQILLLDDNKVTSVDGVVFPSSLIELDLSGNKLASVDGVVFPSSLKNLGLGRNKLTSVDGVVFPSSLWNLYLASNKLTSLDGVVFPSSLSYLYLGSNKLTSLVGVIFPPSLQKLDLSNNSLTSLDGVVFPSSLIELDLSGNAISVLPVCIFDRLTLLTRLYMRCSPWSTEMNSDFCATHRDNPALKCTRSAEKTDPAGVYYPSTDTCETTPTLCVRPTPRPWSDAPTMRLNTGLSLGLVGLTLCLTPHM
jgi:Leucine-rich repeat (LRR) protein